MGQYVPEIITGNGTFERVYPSVPAVLDSGSGYGYDFPVYMSSSLPGILEPSFIPSGLPYVIEGGFRDDFYNRIWFNPEKIIMNNPRPGSSARIEIWNAYLVPVTLADIKGTGTGVDTVQFIPGLPVTLPSLGSIELSAITDGTGNVKADFVMDFGKEKKTFSIRAEFSVEIVYFPDSVTEKLTWNTLVSKSYDSSTQRIALRAFPSQSFSMTYILDTPEMQEIWHRLILKHTGKDMKVLLSSNAVMLDAPTERNMSELFYDRRLTDIMPGESVFISAGAVSNGITVQVKSLTDDGCLMETPSSLPIPAGSMVTPFRTMLVQNGAFINCEPVTSTVSMNFTEMKARKPDRDAKLPTVFPVVDSMPVMIYRYNTETPVTMSMDRNVIPVNHSIMPEVYWYPSNNMDVVRTVTISADRYARPEFCDAVKRFFMHLRGRQKHFLLPCWYPPIELVKPPEGDTDFIIAKDTELAALFGNNRFMHYLMLETTSMILPVHVTSAINDDDTGGIKILLDRFIPKNTDPVKRVSFMMKSRLESDTITLQHRDRMTDITFSVRSTDN